VSFVGVNIKDARDDAVAFDDEHELEYPDIRDERGQIFRDYGLTGQPETFFIDADGMIVEHVNGPVFADSLDLLLQELVAADG
jgi:cytochrome c biogenesis protein CcmG/thiol:disulfide interchange protein DsbE